MKRERGEAEDKERDKPCFMKRLNLLKYNPKELVGGPTLFDYPFYNFSLFLSHVVSLSLYSNYPQFLSLPYLLTLGEILGETLDETHDKFRKEAEIVEK